MSESTEHRPENRILLGAATILFVLTLLSGTVPVHLIDFISKRLGKSESDQNETSASINATAKPQTSLYIQVKRIFTKDRIVQFLAQVGGGVLLYTAFIHMLPEIRENYEQYQNEKNNNTDGNSTDSGNGENKGGSSLPLVDFCACAGFFAIFLVEEAMHSLFLKNHHHHEPPVETQNELAKGRNHSLNRRRSLRQYMQTRKHYYPHVDENEHTTRTTTGEVMKDDQNRPNSTKLGSMARLSESHPISSTCQPSRYDACEQADFTIDCNGMVNKCDVENISNFEGFVQEDRTIFARIFDAFLMILAFSCHAVFDGISIGVQTGSKVWTVLIAILSHKLLIAFILSVQIHERCFQTVKLTNQLGDTVTESKPIKRAKPILWVFSTLFAAMSPIGILIVMAMNNSSDVPIEKELHIVVLAAISAGTIIYIVFLEIIDKSSSRTHISGLAQWIALVLGFAAMHLVSSLFHED